MIVIDKFSAKSNNHLNLSHHTPPFNQNNILVPPPQRHPYQTLIKPTSHPELTPLQMAEIARNQPDHVDPYFFTLPSSPHNEQLKPYTRLFKKKKKTLYQKFDCSTCNLQHHLSIRVILNYPTLLPQPPISPCVD